MTEKKKVEIPSHVVSISLIMDVVARSYNKRSALEDLIQYTGKNGSYIKSAIIVAKQLQMLKVEVVDNKECYSTAPMCGEKITTTPSNELKTIIFREWLQKWEPYIIFIKYISTGDSPNVAIRKMSSFFSISSNLNLVEKLFLTWGKATQILNSNGLLIQNDFEIESKMLYGKLAADNINDFILRMYLINNLTEEVFNWLQHDEIEELVNSLHKYPTDPRNAVECGGRAFEDFLRRIAIHLNVDVSKQNGITQVANTIYSAKDANGQLLKLIHPKQNDISIAIGDIRNMAGHSKEAKTLDRWEISSTSTIGYLLTVISCIKSIYYYVYSGKLIF